MFQLDGFTQSQSNKLLRGFAQRISCGLCQDQRITWFIFQDTICMHVQYVLYVSGADLNEFNPDNNLKQVKLSSYYQ